MTEAQLPLKTPEKVDEFLAMREGSVSEDFRERAKELAERAELNHPINRAPSSIAAASIYLAGLLENEKQTQPEIREYCGVSEREIRETYQKMCDYEDFPLGGDVRDEAADSPHRFVRVFNRVLDR